MIDIIVIGGGTAGMTAALYALRAGKSVMILEAESFGGQIASSPCVENFPSVKQISGLELSDMMFDQVTALGAEFDIDKVVAIEKLEEKHFIVTTEYSKHECKSIIIASGVKHRRLNLANEESFIGNGIYYCAVCDGAFFKDKDVLLVGDGNSALQYALLLSNYCSKVTMVTMFNKFFGDKALQDAVRSRSNVEIIPNYLANEIIVNNGKMVGVRFKGTESVEVFDVLASALFVAIGQVPDNKAFSNLVELDNIGFIVANESCCTKTSGVYVAGDCRTKAIRQLTTAAADGAVAALAASNYLDK